MCLCTNCGFRSWGEVDSYSRGCGWEELAGEESKLQKRCLSKVAKRIVSSWVKIITPADWGRMRRKETQEKTGVSCKNCLYEGEVVYQCWTSSSGPGWLYCSSKSWGWEKLHLLFELFPSLKESGDRTSVTTAATRAAGGWNWIPACLLPLCWWLVLEAWLGGQGNTLQLLPWAGHGNGPC